MGIFKRNRSWFIDFYVEGRRKREKAGRTRGEAQRALAKRQTQVADGKFEFRSRVNIPSFEQFAQQYREYAKTNKRGYSNEEYRLQQLTKTFGSRKLSDLKAWDAEKLKIRLSKDFQPATVNRLLGNLKHMMTMAVKWDILTKNPFAGVKLLPVASRIERILGIEEETRLLTACERVRAPYLRSMVTLALNTGMRKGEILSLQWAQVDLTNRFIHVQNGKTPQSDRRIPMNNTVFGTLTELSKKRKVDLVFPSHRKLGDRFRDPKVGFMKAIRLAGIAPIRFHDLRHTFGTRLVRAGVDLITVQHLLGHAKITMTARYAHSLADDKIAAVRRLDFAAVCSLPDPKRTPEANPVGVVSEVKVLSAT